MPPAGLSAVPLEVSSAWQFVTVDRQQDKPDQDDHQCNLQLDHVTITPLAGPSRQGVAAVDTRVVKLCEMEIAPSRPRA